MNKINILFLFLGCSLLFLVRCTVEERRIERIYGLYEGIYSGDTILSDTYQIEVSEVDDTQGFITYSFEAPQDADFPSYSTMAENVNRREIQSISVELNNVLISSDFEFIRDDVVLYLTIQDKITLNTMYFAGRQL